VAGRARHPAERHTPSSSCRRSVASARGSPCVLEVVHNHRVPRPAVS
jgi:hypothetical protein